MINVSDLELFFLPVTNQTEKTYVFISDEKTWNDAQAYCREHYTDLPMIENIVENNEESMGNDTNSWRWSATGQTSKTGYHNWNVGEPNSYMANANCVIMDTNGKWYDTGCHSLRSFVCYDGKKRFYGFYLLT
uniref:C-type lectin domain-containing protein n=1 Tax=Dicentrarchus labrax TaxID=13489 RepID=A0A8P4K8L7_DICLA